MTLHQRYLHAQKAGWQKLRRAAEGTVRNRYHAGLHRFFGWLKQKKLLAGDPPTFAHSSRELMSELPRDAFRDEELIELFSLPLFTGCHSSARIWTPGQVFCRSGLYWSYLILILTGMRVGEVGQIRLDQIKTDGEFYYFDLRPFDAAKGRVPIGHVTQLKTGSSARVVPIHPLLVDLGLIDHAKTLDERGETRLLPDLDPYVKSTDEVRWSQPITKSWQYVKKNKLENSRGDLSLYSTRHLMAAWLDSSNVAERSRDRILGHALSGSNRRYGRNGALDPAEARIIAAIEPPVVARIREVLMGALKRAEAGDLRIVAPGRHPTAKKRRA
ncbi:MAG: hypothetical protein MEP57_09285 [Microvirga sp.]|nr:hypothetical protein [Microvirga sp.]